MQRALKGQVRAHRQALEGPEQMGGAVQVVGFESLMPAVGDGLHEEMLGGSRDVGQDDGGWP